MTKIGFILNSQTLQDKYKAFTFQYQNKIKEMKCTSEDLEKLKDYLTNKVCFANIKHYYTPKYILGVGASAKVLFKFYDKNYFYQLNQVLLAQEIKTNKYFAIKAIDKEFLQQTTNGFDILKGEIQIMKTLANHPQFIKLFEIFEGVSNYYLIIQLLEGKSLKEKLNRIKGNHQGKLASNEIKIIIGQLLESVKILHEQGIIHRDLKPDNIMFEKEDQYEKLKIVDFGLATFKNVPKYLYPKCGTPGYVAPEVLNVQNEYHKYDEVCDIFSIGCIFYKLITGVSLFNGQTQKEILKQNKKCQIDFDSFRFQLMPRDTQILMRKMLDPNPKTRIAARDALQQAYFSVKKETKVINTLSTQEILYSPQLNIKFSSEIQSSNQEGFSPFKQYKQNLRFYTPRSQLPSVNEIIQSDENESLTQKDFDEEVKQGKIEIKQLPGLKKPHLKNKDQLNNSVSQNQQQSIESFYINEPLQGITKQKEQNRYQSPFSRKGILSKHSRTLQLNQFYQ